MAHTKHAEKRIKQRSAFSKADTAQLAEDAKEYGQSQAEFKGAFRKYLDKLGITWKTKPIVYKHMIFIFNKGVLVTVLPISQKFHKYIKTEAK